MYAYCREEDSNSPVGVVTDGVCIAYGTGKVREALEHENLTGIQGGINGFVFIGSGFQDDTVTLKVSFLYTGPGGLFRIFPARIQLLGQAGPGQAIAAVSFPVRLQGIWSTLQNGKVSIILPGTVPIWRCL